MLPLRYSLRNVLVRRASAALTILGIGLTVTVFAGVIALRDGFQSVYTVGGDPDIAIYLRPGAGSEGESVVLRDQAEILVKERPEIARNAAGRPLAAMESFLAVYLETVDGGLVNVPLRGIQEMSIELMDENVQLVEGRWLEFGTDEIVVGRPLTQRMRGAQVGDSITLNMTPFTVVGVFEHVGAQNSEVWGDVERMMEALDRPFLQRVVARVVPGTDFDALSRELSADVRTPMKVMAEPAYLLSQTTMLGIALQVLAGFLTLIMGGSAVLGATNTMLSSVGARTHEIGVLLAVGYSRTSIFLTFLLESAVIGLLGGVVGVLLVLPFDGLQTGMMNFNTFTDVSFAFRVTPSSMGTSFTLAFALGLVGGAIPAWRAARQQPVEALRAL